MASKQPVVIVESPTKARTIKRFLAKDYTVLASNGHIRDLPNSAAEIPAKLKKESWAKLGVDVDKDFTPLYVVPREKKTHVKTLKDAVKDASVLYLATDEDREGESISWHLIEILKPKSQIKRLVFHEITKEAIETALGSPREIDEHLVRAQETRRIIDRLFGYEISPLLWKKMLPRLSAGRVQSVAVRLLAEREWERIKFHAGEYWGLSAVFGKQGRQGEEAQFAAELEQINESRVALGRDFDPNTGKLREGCNAVLLDGSTAAALRDRLLTEQAVVTSIDEKPYSSTPPPPFITSSLQQEANRKLRLSPRRTMNIAQKLYENGFITYMRTDSTILSGEALNAARKLINQEYGQAFLPDQARFYKSSVKNAQEAHEAIRPAGESFTHPSVVQTQLGPEAAKLYELIYTRTIASQMTNARGTHIAVKIRCGEALFRAAGKTVEFPGFLRAYVEGAEDPEEKLAERERVLPGMKEAEVLDIVSIKSEDHTTQAPARFTEGSLIRELERLGIGRPSTWATIVDLVLDRSYAFKKGNTLVPTFVALGLVGLLQKHFTHLLDYRFTARLEDDLDAISRGEAETKSYLREFYFGNGHPGLKSLVERGASDIDPREVCSIPITTLPEGELLEVRIGRYGPFLSSGTHRVGIPELMPPDELTVDKARAMIESAARGPEALGTHPETSQPIYLKNGPYSHYIQLGESDGNGKPKMVSLLPGMEPESVNLDVALQLLALPRSLGKHPESAEDVLAANGRYGPYVKCGRETRSIPADRFSPLDIDLDQALELLRQPAKISRSSKPQILRELGRHPVTDQPLTLMSGRYGPYVTDGKLNASLTKGMDPQTITVEDSLSLLEARAARVEASPGKKPTRGRTKKRKKKD